MNPLWNLPMQDCFCLPKLSLNFLTDIGDLVGYKSCQCHIYMSWITTYQLNPSASVIAKEQKEDYLTTLILLQQQKSKTKLTTYSERDHGSRTGICPLLVHSQSQSSIKDHFHILLPPSINFSQFNLLFNLVSSLLSWSVLQNNDCFVSSFLLFELAR